MAEKKTRPVLTPENIRLAFMKQFAAASWHELRGIIEGLQVVHCLGRKEDEEAEIRT